jgi:hypothetical protein
MKQVRNRFSIMEASGYCFHYIVAAFSPKSAER